MNKEQIKAKLIHKFNRVKGHFDQLLMSLVIFFRIKARPYFWLKSFLKLSHGYCLITYKTFKLLLTVGKSILFFALSKLTASF